MGLTAPSRLSKGIRRLAVIASIEEGSTSSVHRVFLRVAKASQSSVEDCLNYFQQSILLNPFASTPDGPLDPFVLRAASLIISPFISRYILSGISCTGP